MNNSFTDNGILIDGINENINGDGYSFGFKTFLIVLEKRSYLAPFFCFRMKRKYLYLLLLICIIYKPESQIIVKYTKIKKPIPFVEVSDSSGRVLR